MDLAFVLPNQRLELGLMDASAQTLAMRNSVRHLLSAAPATASAAAGSAISPKEGATPVPADAVPSTLKAEETPSRLSPLPAGAPLPALPTGAVEGSPAPAVGPAPSARSNVPTIDVRYESSKLPLDVGVVESIMAIVSGGAASAAAEDRVKKIATNLLIVGGTGGIHNIGFAVESRVAPALAARMPVLNGVLGYVPCPREIEPEHLAWKGIAALGKLDSANEMWLCRDEWEALGMRALRERAFYWN